MSPDTRQEAGPAADGASGHPAGIQARPVYEKQRIAGPGQKGINWRDVGLLGLIVLVIAAAVIFAGPPLVSGLQQHLGLDLKGGVSVTFQAVPTPGAPVTQQAMTSLADNFERRINGLGVASPIIQQKGSDQILVQLAGVKDPDQAVAALGKTAQLEFKTADGKVVLTGADLKSAIAEYSSTNQPEVAIVFDARGTQIFSQVTAANVGKQIGIYLDNDMITNPVVQEAITGGNAVINGGFKTLADAQQLAVLLNAGALPVQVKLIQNETISATLGQDSLSRSLTAGVIGLALVLLFMLLYYRVPGIVADLSLIVYALIMAGIYILFRVTLTLPGIAAFIISVGMAVDANILIYERLKEELRAGKTLRSSFEAGFRHALRTILDCNVNTLIGACVLYYFGSSDIKGFAVTLFIGVFTSLFTAVTFTRLVLYLLVGSRLVLSPKWYGVFSIKLAAVLGRVPA